MNKIFRGEPACRDDDRGRRNGVSCTREDAEAIRQTQRPAHPKTIPKWNMLTEMVRKVR